MSGLGSFFSSVCSAVGNLCSKIGGAVMGGVSSLVSSFLPDLGSVLGPTLKDVLSVFVAVVSFLAELFTDKPQEEKPEEIAMKAEQADKKPENFDSINDYIEYLRNEVQLDTAKLEKLTPEERQKEIQKYQLVGLGLYIKNIEEQQGVKLDPDFLKSIPKLKAQGYEAADIANLMQSMKNNGVTDMKQYVDFMKGDLQPGSPERQQVGASVKDMVEQHFKGEDVNMRKEINKLADTVRE